MADVLVECHAGYRGEEAPRRFHREGRTIDITEVLARWTEPDARLFRGRGDDGRIYVLRHSQRGRRWEIPEICDDSGRGHRRREGSQNLAALSAASHRLLFRFTEPGFCPRSREDSSRGFAEPRGHLCLVLPENSFRFGVRRVEHLDMEIL